MPKDQKNIPPEVQNDSDNNEAPSLTNITNEIVAISEAMRELSLLSNPDISNCERDAVDSSMPSTSSFTRITQLASGNIIAVSFGRLANGFHNPKINDTPQSAQTIENLSNVSADMIESKVASLVKLMLLKYQMKEPITKEEMIQRVIKNYEHHFNEIFLKAHKRMEMIFGLDVKEVDQTNHCYIFIISLGLTFDGMSCGKEGIPKTGILILILGIIFMKDNSATEQDIWDILNQIGIYANEHHFVFGDTKELITNHFVRENYLVYRQMANEPNCFEFLWGKRAHAETSKMKVLEFMAMVNEAIPSDFGYKYEEALEDEIKRGIAKEGLWGNLDSPVSVVLSTCPCAAATLTIMSHRQTSLPNSEAPFWALSEIQNDSMVLEQSSGSFHPVVTDIEMEDLVAEMTCVSVGAQSCFMSAESETVTSSSKPEEGFAGQAVANSSGPSKTIVNISAVLPDDIDRKIALLVKLMVLKYQVKQSLTRKEIAEIVIREHGDHFDEIFFRACLRLEMIFGLEVKEMDPSIHSYVLVTKLGLTFDGMLCGEEGIPKTGILILVLGLIFLKGNSATEQEIWQVLNLIGIHTDERHFIFGDTKELITKDFVREKYLMCQKVPDSSSEQLKYLWGPRAHAETTKMKVLEFMAKIHGSDPSDFGHWYEDALQDEAERAGSSTSSY
ncbi:melanoma-associated antigen B16 [Sorex fumeus]|uniref:melanoma-associated antigen B16 n=1 Tax=Sorex fumeus TaxID=62283 RepID=UPI0024ACB446|nr:melanoma-associated antigen B16 [Sorex fumeus]